VCYLVVCADGDLELRGDSLNFQSPVGGVCLGLQDIIWLAAHLRLKKKKKDGKI
jgi:hypothetical protein